MPHPADSRIPPRPARRCSRHSVPGRGQTHVAVVVGGEPEYVANHRPQRVRERRHVTVDDALVVLQLHPGRMVRAVQVRTGHTLQTLAMADQTALPTVHSTALLQWG